MRATASPLLPAALLGLFLAVFPVPARASEISGRLDKMVRSLSEGHKSRRPEAQKETLAVFNLNSSEKLTKEKVGFALSELLTQRFVRAGSFVVVERQELRRVFEEAKLQLTGAIDPQTAVELGKMIGARILLLGSVEKLAGNYQANARLVEVASGEVLAAAYEELPAKLFEEEAQPYLALVPEEQAIGLYVGFGYGLGSVRNFTPAPLKGPGQQVTSDTLTLTNETPKLHPLTVGARYSPVRWLMADLSLSLDASDLIIHSNRTVANSVSSTKSDHKLGGFSVSFSLDWVKPLRPTLRAFAGLGAAFQILEFKDGTQGGLGTVQDNFSFSASGGDSSFHLLRPFLRIGTEWRPQARLGWALFGNVFPLKAARSIYVFSEPTPGTGGIDTSQGPYLELKLPTFSFGTTLSLYF